MKTIQIILIFLMIFLPFGGWLFLLNFGPKYNLSEFYPVPLIMGIGQLLLLFGFMFFLILQQWSEYKLATMKNDYARFEKEMEIKRLNIEYQLINAKERLAHEARRQAEKEIATILQACKLTRRETIETPQEGKSKFIKKEIIESESIEQKLFDKAIERLNEMNSKNHNNQ
mgnify:CR=1 FL=1